MNSSSGRRLAGMAWISSLSIGWNYYIETRNITRDWLADLLLLVNLGNKLINLNPQIIIILKLWFAYYFLIVYIHIHVICYYVLYSCHCYPMDYAIITIKDIHLLRKGKYARDVQFIQRKSFIRTNTNTQPNAKRVRSAHTTIGSSREAQNPTAPWSLCFPLQSCR